MNELKDRTNTALNYGIVEITANGKTEQATNASGLIPVEKHKAISTEERRGKQLHFYSLSEAKWKAIDFDQVSEVKILTLNSRTVNTPIFKK